LVQIPIIWFLNIWWYALSLLLSSFFIFLHFPPSHTKILLYSFVFILSHCAINISIYLNSLYEPLGDCYDQENRAERKKKNFHQAEMEEKKVVKLKWPSRWKLRSRMTFCWFLNVLSLYFSPVYIYSPVSISFPFHFISSIHSTKWWW